MKTSRMEQIMDEADAYCSTCSERLPHAQVFEHARDVVIAKLNRVDALCVNDSRHDTRAQSLKILKECSKLRLERMMKIVRCFLVVIFAFSGFAQLTAAPRQSPLKFGVGKKSRFVMPNGDRAYVTGVAGLKASDFSSRDVDKMLTFEDSRIVDAEKSPETHVDDYWCEQLTDCNLLVWTGWAKYAMGVTNEDDFAEMLLKNPEICKEGIIDWTVAKRGYVIDESTDKVIAWVHGKEKSLDALVWRVAKYIGDADRMAYMQVDWQNRGGGHAVTCCGYTVKKGMNKDPLKPESLSGLFIINSDNDKRKGSGGRKAPNTIQFQSAWFDKEKKAFFSEFPHGDIGKIRFFCFLRAYDKKLIKFLKPVK